MLKKKGGGNILKKKGGNSIGSCPQVPVISDNQRYKKKKFYQFKDKITCILINVPQRQFPPRDGFIFVCFLVIVPNTAECKAINQSISFMFSNSFQIV